MVGDISLLSIIDNGKNNEVVLHKSLTVTTASSIKIDGNNCKIHIDQDTVLNNAHFVMQSDYNSMIIGKNCRITGRYIQKITNGNSIKIGDNVTFGQVHIINGEGCQVTIGDDCMFAFDISLRTTDSHAIVDAKTGERLNAAQDIFIGEHVWVAAHAVLLKGTNIARNSIVALKSLVSGEFTEEGVVIAGVPAKIIKRGVTWERPLLG